MTKYIKIPIESHFAGDYRLEYDSKYISLIGGNKRLECFGFSDSVKSYEEDILISCVVEARNANPRIKEVTESCIVVELNIKND